MKRWATLVLAAALASCAPTQQRGSAPTPLPFQADFSDAGVTWVARGQAYVARAPDFTVLHSPLPAPAVAAAWQGNVAWGALPATGLIVTLDGPPETQLVGRAWKLSHLRVYLQDGTALNYGRLSVAGSVSGGVLGTPSAVLTGGDGQDYALLGGDLYLAGNPPTLLSSGAQAHLYATWRGVATSNVPAVQTSSGLYRLSGAALERVDGSGNVVGSVQHGPGLVGQVGGRIVTLSEGGQIRVFLSDLQEVRP